MIDALKKNICSILGVSDLRLMCVSASQPKLVILVNRLNHVDFVVDPKILLRYSPVFVRFGSFLLNTSSKRIV